MVKCKDYFGCLYSNWREAKLSTNAWLTEVCERLDVIKDVATETGFRENENRKHL